MSEAWERPIYRDRHGRGERGVLTGIWRPQYRKRSAIFDALAVGQLKRLRTAWPDMINSIQFAVTDTAPTDPLPWEDQQALRSLAYPAEHGKPARIMLFRRPLLNRAIDKHDLQMMIRDELVKRISELSGMDPEEIDPGYTGDWR